MPLKNLSEDSSFENSKMEKSPYKRIGAEQYDQLNLELSLSKCYFKHVKKMNTNVKRAYLKKKM